MITAGGYTTETAVSAIEAKLADAVAFGRMSIANPDLPQRIRAGVPLNAFDRSTAYGGGAHGNSLLLFWLHLRKPQGHFFATIAGYCRFSHDNHFRSRG
jgi:NADH:flavin oxidoreductase / NADH oxidase family